MRILQGDVSEAFKQHIQAQSKTFKDENVKMSHTKGHKRRNDSSFNDPLCANVVDCVP